MAHFFRIDFNGQGFNDLREPEVAAVLLRYVQALITWGGLDQVIYDNDGNRIGTASFNTGQPS